MCTRFIFSLLILGPSWDHRFRRKFPTSKIFWNWWNCRAQWFCPQGLLQKPRGRFFQALLISDCQNYLSYVQNVRHLLLLGNEKGHAPWCVVQNRFFFRFHFFSNLIFFKFSFFPRWSWSVEIWSVPCN